MSRPQSPRLQLLFPGAAQWVASDCNPGASRAYQQPLCTWPLGRLFLDAISWDLGHRWLSPIVHGCSCIFMAKGDSVRLSPQSPVRILYRTYVSIPKFIENAIWKRPQRSPNPLPSYRWGTRLREGAWVVQGHTACFLTSNLGFIPPCVPGRQGGPLDAQALGGCHCLQSPLRVSTVQHG